MKVGVSNGQFNQLDVTIATQIANGIDFIGNDVIPAKLRSIQLEYGLKIRLSNMLPQIDMNLISDAVDNIDLNQFSEYMADQPDNNTVKILLAKAICFELRRRGVTQQIDSIVLSCIGID